MFSSVRTSCLASSGTAQVAYASRGDSVAQVTSVDFAEIQISLTVRHSGRGIGSVSCLHYHVPNGYHRHRGMSALGSFNCYFEEEISLRELSSYRELRNGINATASFPIKISPSSSESRFNRISPLMKPLSTRSKAPVSPVSSSTVNKHSSGPCPMLSSARIASLRRYHYRLRESFPLAFSHSPSISVSMRIGEEVVLYVVVLFTPYRYETAVRQSRFLARSSRLF